MQKNMTQFKCTVNGKEQIFSCDIDCSTAEAKESLFQFLKCIGNIEDAHAAKMKAEQDSKVEIIEDSKVGTLEESWQ